MPSGLRRELGALTQEAQPGTCFWGNQSHDYMMVTWWLHDAYCLSSSMTNVCKSHTKHHQTSPSYMVCCLPAIGLPSRVKSWNILDAFRNYIFIILQCLCPERVAISAILLDLSIAPSKLLPSRSDFAYRHMYASPINDLFKVTVTQAGIDLSDSRHILVTHLYGQNLFLLYMALQVFTATRESGV